MLEEINLLKPVFSNKQIDIIRTYIYDLILGVGKSSWRFSR